jgi:ATP-dependent Clp protease ATP-binding subunit ClpC
MFGTFRRSCGVVAILELAVMTILFVSVPGIEAFLPGKQFSSSTMPSSRTTSRGGESNVKRFVFERMSEDCIGAIVTAQKQAQKFSQRQVELPFLVAGIVDLPESPAMERTLKQYGVTFRKTTSALQEVYPEQEKSQGIGSFFQARDPDDDLPFGKDVQKTLKEAGAIADAMESNTIQTHHLFLAMLEYKEGDPPKAVGNPSTNGAYYLLTRIDPEIQSLDMCISLLGNLAENVERDLVTGVGSTAGTKTLDELGVDLTAQARDGLLDVVQGRDKEINSCIRTLVRRRKNNVCLVGEAGVGKTSIVEGLAQILVSDNCPPRLKGTRLVSLELANLVAGTKYRGEFEERLQAVVAEVTDEKSPPTILFIDEVSKDIRYQQVTPKTA